MPTALIVGATIWFATGDGNLRSQSGMAFNLFVFPPPFLAVFLAGLLAPRAGYLAGFTIGLIAAATFGVYMVAGPVPGSPTIGDREGYVLYGFLISPSFGLLLGAAGGGVRRATLWFVRQAMGIRGPSAPVGWSLSARLTELDEARARGLISDEEYAKRRAKILEGG